jgi:membrane-bound serine protease (ClpP class)
VPAATVRRVTPNWAERLVRFLTQPVLSSLLMSVGILGILVELRTPGFGIPGALGVASLGLFFWGHWLVRLAGWEELILVAVGLALVAIEMFVVPGFGLAGLVGIASLVGGLGLSLLGSGATASALLAALGRVALSLLLAVAGGALLLRLLPRLPVGRRLVLSAALERAARPLPDSAVARDWLGQRGTALSPLRPAGIVDVGGERLDVVSEGEFIERGAPVVVTRAEGNRLVVRRSPRPAGGA